MLAYYIYHNVRFITQHVLRRSRLRRIQYGRRITRIEALRQRIGDPAVAKR